MASSDNSTFNRFQSLVTILTPIIVAVGGVYGYLLQEEVASAKAKATAAQTQIAEIQTSIRNVEAMETYFKMMGGTNNAEAKMAAYALYMLNKEDPEMAVSMIMAPGKEELLSVLIDLGSREPLILAEVQKILATQDDTREGTSMQQTAQKIIADIGNSALVADVDKAENVDALESWSYLGNFDSGEGARVDLPAGSETPAEGSRFTLIMDVNLRSDYPRKGNSYKSGGIIGVALKGNEITIIEAKPDSKNRVWAKISVVPQ
jgi:hypothetical protein